jgi:hypothetical protein
MFTNPYLVGEFARERQRDMLARAGPAAPGTPVPHPRPGAARRTGRPADGPLPPAQPPGAGIMNHPAAASSHPSKRARPWAP